MRSTPCTRVQTTPSKPSERNSHTSNTLPTTQTVTLESDRTTMAVIEEEERVSDEISTSITPTSATLDNELLRNERVESGKQDGISIVVILLIIAVALCLVLSVSVIVKRFIPVRRYMLRSFREQDSHNGGYRPAQEGTPPRPHSSASDQSSQESATPVLNRSKSTQPDVSVSPHPMPVSTSRQANGAVSSQPNTSASLQSNGSAPSPPNGHESPQPNRSGSASPQPSASVLSQTGGSESTHPNQSAAAAAQSVRSAQEQDKSNPGE